MATQREIILEKFREMTKNRKPIIGVGAGCGLSAVSAVDYGADLLILYNSGRFRMAGRGATAGRMPFSNANKVVMEMADEIMPVAKNTPVIAGVFAQDPYIDIERFLHTIKERGFKGVQNFPTVGSIGGILAQELEKTNLGYEKEVEMIALARKMDLITTPYCFNLDETARMAKAGADLIVAHMDLTSSGLVGAENVPAIEVCASKISEMVKLAHSINPNAMVICHGGPISKPSDAQYIFDNVPGIVGFYGASSNERIPVEAAIVNTVKEYKSIKLGGGRYGK